MTKGVQMKFRYLLAAACAASVLALSAPGAVAADGDVQKVVDKTLADNPDMKALCGGREATIRPAVTKATVALMSSGAISGNPNATGEAAGAEVTKHCIKFLSGG